MSTIRSATAAAVATLGLLLTTPATAQFDPQHSHLECFQIRDKSITKTVITDNQFGRQLMVKLTPTLLCLPTKKTCCQPGAAGGCVPTTCPTGPIEPSAVPHFKCYKVSARTCLDAACTKLSSFKNGSFTVDLEDQFGRETNLRVNRPQLLCAPVKKTVVSPTTTTTTQTTATTTTTTLQSCKSPSSAGLCGGTCPPQTTCLATSPDTCDCVPVERGCTGGAAGACGGLCPNVTQTCTPSPTAPCACAPTPACGQSAPACNGACPTGHTCVHMATGACGCN